MTMDGTRLSRRGFLGMGLAAGVITLTACGADNDKGSASGNATAASLVMTVWGRGERQDDVPEADRPAGQEVPGAEDHAAADPDDQYAQKVQTMIAGGNGPDIMQVAESVNVYSSKNQIQPLDDLASKAGLDLDERFGAIGKLYSYQDKVYAIPDRSGAMIVFYNKALFDGQGHQGAERGLDLGRRAGAFKELTVPGKQWGYAGGGWWAQWWSFVYQNGGKIIDDSGKPAVAGDEVVDALQWTEDLMFKHHVVPTADEYADMGADVGGDPAFADGKVAMNTTGFWGISGLPSPRSSGTSRRCGRARSRPSPRSAAAWPSPGPRRTRRRRSRRSTSSPRPRRSSRSSRPARTCRPTSRCRRATRS